jgi:hypothetical protein
MTVATHRVVGTLEWPAGTDAASVVTMSAAQPILAEHDDPGLRVLSLRLPVSDSPHPAILSADVVQLRRDLQRLFDEYQDQ